MMNLMQFMTICSSADAIQQLEVEKLYDFPYYMYMKDRKGKYIGVNTYLVKDVGLNKETDVLGVTDFDLCIPETADSLTRNDNSIMARDQSATFIEPILFHSGKKVTSISYKTPLRGRNK